MRRSAHLLVFLLFFVTFQPLKSLTTLGTGHGIEPLSASQQPCLAETVNFINQSITLSCCPRLYLWSAFHTMPTLGLHFCPNAAIIEALKSCCRWQKCRSDLKVKHTWPASYKASHTAVWQRSWSRIRRCTTLQAYRSWYRQALLSSLPATFTVACRSVHLSRPISLSL